MDRKKKLQINTSVSLLYRIIALLYGLVLPRLILLYFGSETNGLINSINNFLNIIAFLDFGVGAVVEATLYKPLSENDSRKVNQIMTVAKKHFRKIAYVLIIYIFFLIIIFPRLTDISSLSIWSVFFLIVSMSISKFAQYYFGITNEILLNADQKGYIQLLSEIVVIILNLTLSIALIVAGAHINQVIFFSSLIYLIRPIYLKWYTSQHYNIEIEEKVKSNPIPQLWNGVAQHVAYTVQNSLDTIILTIFSSLENVSIYSVYNIVTRGLNSIIHSLTNSLKPFFGNLLANNEEGLLNYYFDKIEWFIHTVIVLGFSICVVMIIPFVELYTSGVEDINYYAPLFSFLLVISQAVYCIRIPYNYLIQSAGHFRQTQTSSIIEVVINLVVSLLCIHKFELVGVALGTLTSMTYRTIYLVLYLRYNILFRSIKKFGKQIFVDIITFIVIVIIGIKLTSGEANVMLWVLNLVSLGIIGIMVIIIINSLFYKKNTLYIVERIKRKFKTKF